VGDPGQRASFGSALRREVVAHHDIGAVHARYLEAYAYALAGKDRRYILGPPPADTGRPHLIADGNVAAEFKRSWWIVKARGLAGLSGAGRRPEVRLEA
jgi:hypothetical protein